jgi:hypothetical protein
MESWIVFAVQVALSLLTLSVVVLSFVWSRSCAREGRETKRLMVNMSALFYKLHGAHPGPGQAGTHAPVKARHGGTALAPMPLESMTDSRRTAGLTVAMSLPVIERRMVAVTREEDDEAQARPTVEVTPSRPLAVNFGGRERLTMIGIAPQVAEGPMPAGDEAYSVVSTKPTGR